MKFLLLLFICSQASLSDAQGDAMEILDTIKLHTSQENERKLVANYAKILSKTRNLESIPYLEARIEFAYLMSHYGAPEHAIRIYQDLAKDPKMIEQYRHWSWYHRQIGNYYLANKQYDSAIVHQNLAITFAKSENRPPESIGFILNDKGITYYESGNLEMAKVTFDSALHIVQQVRPDDLNFMSRINDNIGLVFIKWGMSEKALPLFKLNKQYLKPEVVHKQIQADIRIGTCLIRMNRLNEAEDILNSALLQIKHNTKDRDGLYELILQEYLNLANALENIHFQNLVMRRTLQYRTRVEHSFSEILKLSIGSLDQILNRHWENIVSTKESELARHKAVASLAIQERRNTQQLYLIFIIVFAFVSMILIGIFRYRTKNLRSKLTIDNLNKKVIESRLENEMLKSHQLNQTLNSQRQDLTNAALEIEKRQKWLEHLQERLTEEANNQEQSSMIKSVISDLKSQMLNEEKNQIFFSQIEVVNRNFYAKLKELFPGITQNELELCGLLRLNMSNKEIATYRNVAHDSIKTARKRLRKKLQLDSDINICDYLQEIK